jgi:O-antigen ligase
MPEYLKALVVILALATAVFAIVKVPACAMASAPADFARRRNLWFGITLAAFLAHNFWIYLIAVAVLLLIALPRESNKLAMYFFVLFAVPPISQQITGLGVINYFFEIDYFRLLALTVLLPAFWSVRKQPDVIPFGRTLSDKFVAAYLILTYGLTLDASTFTNSLRVGVFYSFIDIFLPYYVASRSLKSVQDFRDALMAFVVAALVMSPIAMFETLRHWLLYSDLRTAMGVGWAYGFYNGREGTGLRAVVSTGQPIVFGYVMAVALGIFFFLRKSVHNTKVWRLGVAALVAALIVSISRGPWIGAIVMLLVIVATGPSPATRLMKLGLVGLMVFPVVLATPFGQGIIDILPIVGTGTGDAAENISYRQRLLDIGIGVIMKSPFFGGYNFFMSAEAQELKNGLGIIDLVNTYLGVGLSSGLTGLSLFVGFFISIGVGIFKGMRKLADKNSELYVLGQALFSTLVGILIIIFTVSPILSVPVIYWSMGGLGAAYARLLVQVKAPVNAAASTRPVGFQAATVTNR